MALIAVTVLIPWLLGWLLSLRMPPLVQGWCGKTWAIHHGSRASQGDVLVLAAVFLVAIVNFQRGTIT